MNTVSTTLKFFSLFSSLSNIVSLLFPHTLTLTFFTLHPSRPFSRSFFPSFLTILFYLPLPIHFFAFPICLFRSIATPFHNLFYLHIMYSNWHTLFIPSLPLCPLPISPSLYPYPFSFSVPSLSLFLFSLSLNTYIFLTSNFLHSSSSVSENHLMVSPGSWSPSMIAESKARLRALTASDDTRKAK